MNKDLIKEYLNATFLVEETKAPGLKSTEAIQKDDEDINKEAMKDVEKKMEEYLDGITGEKENEEVVKKYNYSDEQKELHDVGELQKGSMAALEVNGDTEEWDERQEKAIKGDSTMGNANEGDDVANVVPEDQAGFQGPEGNKKVYDDAQKFKKKRQEVEAGNVRKSVGISGADFDDEEIKKSGPKNESKMKRLVFKKEFKGVENALKLIPESYKVDNKTFQMTDGNEKYEIRWEGDINEGRAIVLSASDKNLVNEDMQKMKHLMNFKSQDTTSMGSRKPIRESLDEMNIDEWWEDDERYKSGAYEPGESSIEREIRDYERREQLRHKADATDSQKIKEKMIKSAIDSYGQDFNKLEELGYQVEFNFHPSRGDIEDVLEVIVTHKNGDYLSREEELELDSKFNLDINYGVFEL